MSQHYARKRFGQNFLQDQYIIDRILSSVLQAPGDKTIEIGPGLGAITFPLLKHLTELTVIELDRDLVERLERIQEKEKLTIIAKDVLTVDFSELVEEKKNKLRLVGNLPYNISTPLLFHLFKFNRLISSMHFMLQREVVDRMAAQPGSKTYGRLSVMTQHFCDVFPLFEVPPEAFHPAPKVTSAIAQLIPKQESAYPNLSQYWLNQVCSTAFNQRRKTLRKSLHALVPDECFMTLNIDPSLRAERLSLDQFQQMAYWLQQAAE